MSEANWSLLPALPLRCVLEHLNVEDALAATSTCRNWRALMLYEGRRETLTLRAKELQKNIFLTRLFRKHTKRLHIYIDCSGRRLDNFMHVILPKYYDTSLLNEIVFFVPEYTEIYNKGKPVVKLKRSFTEGIIESHRHTLQNLVILGCEISSCKEDYVEEDVELKALTSSYSSAGFVIPKLNISTSILTSLQHLCLEYVMLDNQTVENISTLPQLKELTIVLNNKDSSYGPLNWSALEQRASSQLVVAVNIINVPSNKFVNIMENVLVENLPLVALRIIFCNAFYAPLVRHIARCYKTTFKELHWADPPQHVVTNLNEYKMHLGTDELMDSYEINPFIFLSWQCTQLQKLVIHGYWIDQYDLIGVCRLRHASLCALQVSSVHDDTNEPPYVSTRGVTDKHTHLNNSTVQEINQNLQFKWRPVTKWSSLHPALTPDWTERDKDDYILKLALEPFGIT